MQIYANIYALVNMAVCNIHEDKIGLPQKIYSHNDSKNRQFIITLYSCIHKVKVAVFCLWIYKKFMKNNKIKKEGSF